jgi:hypothetical protein
MPAAAQGESADQTAQLTAAGAVRYGDRRRCRSKRERVHLNRYSANIRRWSVICQALSDSGSNGQSRKPRHTPANAISIVRRLRRPRSSWFR